MANVDVLVSPVTRPTANTRRVTVQFIVDGVTKPARTVDFPSDVVGRLTPAELDELALDALMMIVRRKIENIT